MISKSLLRYSRYSVIGAAVIIIVAKYFTHEIHAYPNGWSGATEKALLQGMIVGCTCHNESPTEETSLTITTNENPIEAGKTYRFNVGISHPEQLAAGVDIAAFAGTLDTVEGEGLQHDPADLGELVHRSPKGLINRKTSWGFLYTAPLDRSTDTIYAVGNAVNANGTVDNGDFWNVAPKFVVNIQQPSNVSRKSDPHVTITQNPVADRLTLRSHGIELTNISIIDLRGIELRKSRISGADGVYRVTISDLPNGNYTALLRDIKGGSHILKFVKQ